MRLLQRQKMIQNIKCMRYFMRELFESIISLLYRYFQYLTIMEIELKAIAKDKELQLNNTLQQIKTEQDPHKYRLKELEGECKVHSFRPLQFDVLKTILLIIPIILSVVCLLLLKYYRKFRVKCFYKDCSSEEATYFFIQSSDGHEDIEQVFKEHTTTYVYFKSLKYRLENKELIPVGYRFYENFSTISSSEYISYGISDNQRSNNQKIFGKNQHLVKTPSYPEYMFDILTKPFFLLQYVICIIFAFERLYTFVAIYLVFSFITTTINYIMLYFSFKKIKDIAQKEVDVEVIREGLRRVVKNHDLVPGDVVIPNKNQEICFDGILIEGEVFVNEASLTGQSIPVGKFPAKQLSKTTQQNVWLYEGAKVLQARQESRIVVVNVGYATRRGRIIRKILSRVPKVPDFLKTVVYLLFQTCIIGILIYVGTVNIMISNNIVVAFVVFRFLDILAWSFPPSFPIYFNLCYSLSLARLKKHNIFGTQPEKATEAANVRTFCFDKTGTLTQNAIEVYQIVKFIDQANYQKITNNLRSPQNSLICKLFSSCHTTRQTEEGLLGDEVDLRMYLASQFKMIQPQDPKIRFIVQSEGEKLEVLRINQFQSKFQNMSVLVRDAKSNKYYIFVKGAPERIQRNSKVKLLFYDTLVANLSLGGYRTIGYGYKEVSQTQIKSYLQGEREIFETNIIALGVVAFQNKLKVDTRETIDKLIQSDIEPKMITGDNIFIAVETGFRAGIIRIEDKVVLIEGRKQKKYQKGIISGILLYKNNHQIIQSEIQMTVQQYRNSEYSMAIDNDFLLLKPSPQIVRQLKLFARISPENKALIVRRFKEQEQLSFNDLSWSDRTFGPGKWKVGMCGDGANDLMAIREADVGLGISDSDASYGASFTIINMLDVELVVRQSKNASQTIVDTIRYFGTFSFLKIITAVIMVSDVTYFGSNEITYFNFAYSIWVPVVISLTHSASQPTKKRPNANLLSLQNQVLYWINIIFPTIGFVGAYYYFYSTTAFYSNPQPLVTVEKGYIGIECPTSTLIWLLLNIPMVYNSIIIYNSTPFKAKFYQNTLLLILTIVNVIPAIAFFFITTYLQKSFLTVTLPYLQSGISLLIMVVVLSVSWILQELLKNKCFK